MNSFVILTILLILSRYRSLSEFKGDLPKMVSVVLCLFICVLFMFYVLQDRILYQNNTMPEFKRPNMNPEGLRNPKEYDLAYEDLYIKTREGERLHAWLVFATTNNEPKPTIMFFHGNAGNMGFRLPMIKEMVEATGFNVFILSYRGYGNSDGDPNEKNLKHDAIISWETLRNHERVLTDKVFLYGRSLGGAVAISLASNFPHAFKGLIVENTFTSIPDLVNDLYPFLSHFKSLILQIDWNSKSLLHSLNLPILFISGRKDELIPPSHMDDLFASYGNSKKMVSVAEGFHNNSSQIAGEQFYESFREFFNKSD